MNKHINVSKQKKIEQNNVQHCVNKRLLTNTIGHAGGNLPKLFGLCVCVCVFSRLNVIIVPLNV